MKRSIWITWILALLFVIGAAKAFAADGDIGAEQARAAALQAAGVKEKSLDKITVEADREDGLRVYEVEFRADGVKYEYTVEAASGEILQWEIERKAAADGKKVDLEKARAIALKAAGLTEDEVVFSKAKQKKDDGRQVFAIEFYVADKAEYEYTIDLKSGTILEESYERWDEESARAYAKLTGTDGRAAPAAGDEETIGVEEAKAIALEQAGLQTDQVVFSKTKLERDDGRLEYEIEFYVEGEKEYEYEIDALTGEVLSAEIERWDGD